MEPIVFIMPLKSRQVSHDWNHVVAMTLRSLYSILRSSNEAVRIILVCNEFPYTSRTPQLEIVERDFPIPETSSEGMTDKFWKLLTGLVHARAYAPCRISKFDADDLLGKRVISFLTRTRGDVFIINRGWLYADGSRLVRYTSDFHLICGSSNFVHTECSRLPKSYDDNAMEIDLLRFGHSKVETYFRERGKDICRIPFPGAVYCVGSRENHSGNTFAYSPSRRKRLKELFATRLLNSRMREEFGLFPITEFAIGVQDGTAPRGMPLDWKGIR